MLRFFIVVGLVPSEMVMQAAVLSKDWMFCWRARDRLRVDPGPAAHAAGFIERDVVERDGGWSVGHVITRFLVGHVSETIDSSNLAQL
jgi:hypothetical protein